MTADEIVSAHMIFADELEVRPACTKPEWRNSPGLTITAQGNTAHGGPAGAILFIAQKDISALVAGLQRAQRRWNGRGNDCEEIIKI
jgi:MOSC domain-containing protein YiiM